MEDSALLESFELLFSSSNEYSQEFLDVQLHRNIITFPTCSQNVQTRDEPSHWYVSRDFEIF